MAMDPAPRGRMLPSAAVTQHGRFACRMRVYVYHEHSPSLQMQRNSGRHFGFSSMQAGPSHNVSCLEAACLYDTFNLNNVRQYTSEVPVYHRLVTTCPLTRDPEEADVFLVPFYFGYMMSLGWQVINVDL